MEISEVRVKLVERSRERLQAFCSITLDGDFVIRDLKIIDGANGPFVAMPSRKLADRCQRCGYKNHLRARFCNECGAKLRENRAPKDPQGRAKLHADVAHPINSECRERVQKAVIEAYQAELERSKSPDYKPTLYDDDYEDDDMDLDAPEASDVEPSTSEKPARKNQDTFSDYNELIAHLKKDAEGRRRKQEDQRRPGGATFDDAEDQDEAPVTPQPARRVQPVNTTPSSHNRSPKVDKSQPVAERGQYKDARVDQPDSVREKSMPAPVSPVSPPNNHEEDEDDFGAGLF